MKPEDVMEEFEIVTQRGIGDVFGYNTYLEIRDALEKQIPKKVGNPIDMDCKANKKVTYCFACGTNVRNQKYCHNCGQALKWGD